MRIALVILHADPARGGAERYTADLAAALAGQGHDVSLVATSFAQLPASVTRIELDSAGITRAARYQQVLDSLDAHLDETKYDIVHSMLPVRRCDVYHPHAGIAAAAMQRWSVHFNPRRKAMAAAEHALLGSESAPVVLCLSNYLKSMLREHYPALADDRLATLFNAVDLNRFSAAPHRAKEQVRALFIGHDFHRKGLMETLVAMSILKDDRLQLTVVGKQKSKFHWPAQPKINVEFAGEASDPLPFYRDADFLVLPTKHDPCSLVVLEALAMGVPVISTRFNGACEIMTNGVHGFVLEEPRDVNALAEAMRSMLDGELRSRMSAACLQLRPKLSYEHHLATLLRIYEQVLQSRDR